VGTLDHVGAGGVLLMTRHTSLRDGTRLTGSYLAQNMPYQVCQTCDRCLRPLDRRVVPRHSAIDRSSTPRRCARRREYARVDFLLSGFC
jgi:hypothetical protein